MTLIYLDLETGGTQPHHPTIQLAAVAMDGASELGAFSQNITFDVSACDPEALALNHYTPEAWADAVPPAVAASRFAAWLRPFADVTKTSKQGKPYQVARLAGYNITAFDGPRVRQMFGTSFFPCEYLHRDILQRVLFYFDECGGSPENFKLTTVAAWFGIPTEGAHGALADARMCARVHRAIVEGW